MVRVDGRGNGSSLVRVRGLDKKYQRGSEEIHVLQGLNLDVDAGDFVAFMGPSGSGKTTLLNLLGGHRSAHGRHHHGGGRRDHALVGQASSPHGAPGTSDLSSRCTTSSRC